VTNLIDNDPMFSLTRGMERNFKGKKRPNSPVKGHSDDKHQRERGKAPRISVGNMLVVLPNRSLTYFEDPEYSILPIDFTIAIGENRSSRKQGYYVGEEKDGASGQTYRLG
jgi:hypothetical protein